VISSVHPFEQLPGVAQLAVGVSAALLGGLGIAFMAEPGRLMRRRGAGIIAFELAGSATRLNAIRNTWGDAGQSAACKSLLVDTVLFVPGYALLTSIVAAGCADEVAFRTTTSFGGITRVVAWLALVAGSLDLVENLALALVLHGHVAVWGRVSQACAGLKFAAIGASVLWLALFVIPVVVSPTVVAHPASGLR
jgi:hypothetical protein